MKITILTLCFLVLGLSAKAKPATKGAVKQDAAFSLQNGSFLEGTNCWKFQAHGEFPFTLSDAVPVGVTGKSLRYTRDGEDATNKYCFFQSVRFKSGVFYKLSFHYKGDGRLAPMVLVREEGKKGTPRKLFRLTASTEWQPYEVEFSMGNVSEVFRLEFYPGSAPNSYVRPNGSPNAGRAGDFCVAGLALAETTRKDSLPPAGPFQLKTDKVIYKKADAVDLALYADVPVGAKGPFPVLVMVHGGGWVTGSPEEMAWRARFFAERGIAVVRIQYRLVKDGGTFSKAMSDVMDAIEWVRQSAERYEFDLTRFGLTGGSAGGHLSSIAAQRTPECNVYIGSCGLYDALEIGEGRFARKADAYLGPTEEDKRNSSAIYQIKTPPPATILFHGKADPTIDYMQAVRFSEALQRKGARTELFLNEGGGHEVGNPELANRKLLAFLNREWHLAMPY